MGYRYAKYLSVAAMLLVTGYLVLVVTSSYIFPDLKPVARTHEDRSTLVFDAKIRFRKYERLPVRANVKSKKPDLILLHGFGGSLDHWDNVIPHLRQRRVFILDMVGFGGSDHPRLRYDLDTQRRYLLGFMRNQNINKAVLAGISMGASVTAWTAAKAKKEIVGAVMIAPSAFPGSLEKEWPHNLFYRPGLLNRIAFLIVNSSIYRYLFPENLGSQAVGVTGSYNQDFAEALRDIDQPALLVWSRSDDTSIYRFHREYQERIKHLEFLEVSEKLGHDVVRKDPEGTAAFINKFMKKF